MSYNLYDPYTDKFVDKEYNENNISLSNKSEPIYNNDMSARIKMAYQDGYKKGYEDGKNFYNGTLGGQ